MRPIRSLLLAFLVVAAGASSMRATDEKAAGVPRAERVVIISIDGLRPDLLVRAEVPTLRGLLKAGSYTFWARTVAEAYTLPAHTSMLTGVSPQKHGVTWNDHIEQAYPQ